MAEYIDREALGIGLAKRDVFDNPAHADGWNACISIVNAAPAADVAPVVHAHWVCTRDPGPYVCSACRKKMKTPGLIQPLHPEEWKYCSECGAKMDEEAKSDA